MSTNNTRGFVLQLLKIKLNIYFNLYQRFSTFMFCWSILYAQIVKYKDEIQRLHKITFNRIRNLRKFRKEAVALTKEYQMAPAYW